MQIFTMILIGVIGFIALIGGVFWYFSKNSGGGKKYPFLLFSGDGKSAKKIEGQVQVNPENKDMKNFVFEGYSTKLGIREAQLIIGGEGFRLVGTNNKGELHYLESINIDKENYLDTALSPEEKQIVLGGFMENNAEFQNPMAKSQAALIISMMVLTLIVVVGTIYGVGSLVSNSKDMADIAKANKEVASSINAATNTLSEVNAQLVAVTAALTQNENLTRVIS